MQAARTLPLAVVLLLLASCTAAPGDEADAAGRSNVPDPESARLAIDALRAEHVRGVNSRDADLVLGGMADDAVYLAPDLPPVIGRAAFEAVIRPAYETIQPDITMTPREVVIQADHAVEWGCLGGWIEPIGEGDAVRNDGKYVIVYRWREATGWKIARDIYNSGPCEKA